MKQIGLAIFACCLLWVGTGASPAGIAIAETWSRLQVHGVEAGIRYAF